MSEAQLPIAYESLSSLYKALNEKDVLYGLWRRRFACCPTFFAQVLAWLCRVNTDWSRAALALEQFGLLGRAQETFYSAMYRLAQQPDDPTVRTATKAGTKSPPLSILILTRLLLRLAPDSDSDSPPPAT